MFADDVTLYTTVQTNEDCKQLQNDLDCILEVDQSEKCPLTTTRCL